MRYVILPLLVFLSPLGWTGEAETKQKCRGQYSARLVSLQGKAYFDPGGKGNWQPVQLNGLLCEGSRIKVQPYSRVSLVLSNGIVLRLDQGTVLSLNGIAPQQPTALELIKGFIHFISRTPKQLKISTPIANAGPEGTEFAMEVQEEKASLWVYEGKVRFFNELGSLKLEPGQGATAMIGQAPRSQIDITPTDAVQWALYYPPILTYPQPSSVVDSDIRSAIEHYRQGRLDQALIELDAILPEKRSAFYFRVRAAIRLTGGRVALAQQDIQQLLTADPKDSDALALESVIALTRNRKDEAVNFAHRAIAANSSSATAYSALSYAEQSRFDLEKALAAADQATILAPHDAMVWARKAELQLANGSNQESERAAKQALDLDSSLERTQSVTGFYHLLRMETEAATVAFERAVHLDSTAPLARLGLGLAKIRNGNLEEGRRDLEIAAILDPGNSLIRSYLGKAYYEERRSSLAENQYNLAKERDPNDPTPFFYDAILKQTSNRPVEALHDMQKAIELNQNRGIYRSKLLLDNDSASRQTGLGRIFSGIGYDDIANRQAMKSLLIDPSNYSAHRLLSDSNASKPRHEIVRTSEQLQSQLLQPLNYNPIQPSLAYSDLNVIRGVGPNNTAFNEYNRLFERNGVRLTTTGIAGSNSTWGDETALAGLYGKLSVSFGQMHYQTDGFRENNDLTHNLYNVFAQYEVSPTINVQAEYRHRETEHGDLQIQGDLEFFDPGYRRKINQNTYRSGIKISPNLQNDFLISLIHANRAENQLFGKTPIDLNTDSYDFETQHLFHSQYWNTILGTGVYRTDNTKTTKCSIEDQKYGCSTGSYDYNTTQYFGYLYLNLKPFEQLNITTGLSFDRYHDNDKTVGLDANVTSINPKFGLLWKANKSISLRAAFFKSVKTAIVDNQILQPTQISSFNQFYDDLNGTSAWFYGAGLDTHFVKDIYSGIEGYHRHLNDPYSSNKPQEKLYRLYVNWSPLNTLVLNTEFRFENFRYGGNDFSYPALVETASIPMELRLFHPNGLFASIKGTYVNQKMNSDLYDGQNFNSDFYLVDASVGYRLPKQYGLISLEVKNLFDTQFIYRDRQFQLNEQRSPDFIPERLLFAQFTFNFF